MREGRFDSGVATASFSMHHQLLAPLREGFFLSTCHLSTDQLILLMFNQHEAEQSERNSGGDVKY
jgi:hypothetical protein